VIARYILTVLAVLFLVAALWRRARDGGRIGPAAKTWLIVAVLFGAVSVWLWMGGHA
jgi:hypothetical protein